MSNWSRIILTWDSDESDELLRRMDVQVEGNGCRSSVAYPCPDPRGDDSCCEGVATYAWNHFFPPPSVVYRNEKGEVEGFNVSGIDLEALFDGLLGGGGGITEAELMWKSEGAIEYSRLPLVLDALPIWPKGETL